VMILIQWRMELSLPFCPNCNLRYSKDFTIIFYIMYLCFVAQFNIFLLSLVPWCLNLQYVCQLAVQPDLFAIPFAWSHSTIQFFRFLINPQGLSSFNRQFLNGCIKVSEYTNGDATMPKLLAVGDHHVTNALKGPENGICVQLICYYAVARRLATITHNDNWHVYHLYTYNIYPRLILISLNGNWKER
jgi:hypothetical protein